MKAVLLMSYGSPSNLDDVREYYSNIRENKTINENIVNNLKERYKTIGGSPLLDIVKKQSHLLEKQLGSEYRVYFGMRYWNPFIAESIESIKKDGIDHVIAIALTPHYSVISTQKYIDTVNKCVQDTNIKVSFVKKWGNHPKFIESVSQKISDGISKFKETPHVVFTAHSIPKKYSNEYEIQLKESCELIKNLIGLDKYTLAYQSAAMTSTDWLGPDVKDALINLKELGEINILLCPIGFLTDHLEILYDIDVDLINFSKNEGINLKRTESLNTSKKLIEALKSIVLEVDNTQDF